MRIPLSFMLFSVALLAACEHQLRRPNNYPCASAEQCISGVCHGEICAAADPGGSGAVCIDHGDCRSLRCVNGNCGEGARAGGATCRFHEECKSGRCDRDRTCEVDTSPDSGPDAGPDGPRADGPRDLGPNPEKPGDKSGPKPEKVVKPEQGVKPDMPLSDLDKTKDKSKPADLSKQDMNNPMDLSVVDKTAPPDLPVGDAGDATYNITPKPVAVSTAHNSLTPAVATGSGQWLVVWQDDRHKSTANIYGARILFDGTKKPDLAITTGTTGARHRPAVGFNGANYLVAWQSKVQTGGYKIEARVVSATATTLTSPVLTLFDSKAKTGKAPAVACGASNCLVIWTDDSTGTFNVSGALIDSKSGIVTKKAFTINKALGNKYVPSVAYGDSRFLVVWQKTTDMDASIGYQDVFGARVDTKGKVLDPGGETLLSMFNQHKTNPKVAYGSGQFLLVWKDEPDSTGPPTSIRAGRILGASKPPAISQTLLIKTSKSVQNPAVAHDGHAFLVTWSEGAKGARKIMGKEVPKSGQSKSLIYPTVAAISGSLETAAASGGGWRTMVVSQDDINNIYGTRIYR